MKPAITYPPPRLKFAVPGLGLTGWAVFCFTLALALMPAGLGAADRDEVLAAQFLSLKSDFEAQVPQLAGRHDELAALGAATAAKAWAMAALHLAEDQPNHERWERKIELFDLNSPGSKEFEKRQLEAVWLFYDAFYEVNLSLARKGALRSFEAELRRVRSQAFEKLNAVKEKPGASLEKKNIISEAVISMTTISTRVMGGAPMRRPTSEIMGRLKIRQGEIDRRDDVHYRGRMRLLYLAQLRELTSMTFLLGLSAGPPLSEQMAAIHAELNRHGPALASETYSEGLIWTAQAQASIPLAYWMATVRNDDQPGGPASEGERRRAEGRQKMMAGK